MYRDGKRSDEVTDLMDLWQDDFVGFALGCSFSFETALIEAGVPLRHQEIGMTVPMYRTNIETTPSGRSAGRWSSRCGRSRRPMRSAPSR